MCQKDHFNHGCECGAQHSKGGCSPMQPGRGWMCSDVASMTGNDFHCGSGLNQACVDLWPLDHAVLKRHPLLKIIFIKWIEGKGYFSEGAKLYAHEAVVQECKAFYLESGVSQCQQGDQNIAGRIGVLCTAMAADTHSILKDRWNLSRFLETKWH